jgi:uncharacterized protein
MFSLTPRDVKFYDMFITNSETILNSAELLYEFMQDLNNPESKFLAIKDLEHKGDEEQHNILEELNKSFITPLDREDIYAIAKGLDDIIDFIESAASRIVIFNIKTSTKEAKEMCKLIVDGSKELIYLMKELKIMNKSNKIREKIIEVNRIEEQGDVLFRKAVRILFTEDIPVIEVIKQREMYETLENTLDAIEDIANIVEGVVMKHA